MATACIGLGANLGNCCRNIRNAWERLGKARDVKLLALSSPYRSAPVNMDSENWFINAVGLLDTSLPAEELLAVMLEIEAGLGRRRALQNKAADRTVDLDLLYWDDRICNDPKLILPHPAIADRLFVLLPLTEIVPDMVHPVLHRTSAEMLQDFMARRPEPGLEQQVLKISWSEENNCEVAR